MKKKLILLLSILFLATSVFAMKVYLTNSAGSGQAQTDPNASLGGYRSTTELSATEMKNLFDDVSIVEALLGDTEYRMIDVYNDGGTDAVRVQFYMRMPTSSPDTELTFGYNATNQPHADNWNGEALANEGTAPASPTMTFGSYTKTAPLALGTIPAGQSKRVAIKRVVDPLASWTASDLGSIGLRWGGGGAVEDYGDILFWLNAEANDTTGTYDLAASECSDGDESGTWGGDSPTCSGTGPIVGSYSFLFDDQGEQLAFAITTQDLIAGGSGRIGIYFKVASWTALETLFYASNATDDHIVLALYGTDELSFDWFDGTNERQWITTNANVSTAAYWLEIAYDAATDTVAFYHDGVQLTTTGGGAINAFTNMNSLVLGSQSWADPAGEIRIDNFMTSSDKTRDFYTDSLYNDTAKPTGACDAP